jgi:hypothetical protein
MAKYSKGADEKVEIAMVKRKKENERVAVAVKK